MNDGDRIVHRIAEGMVFFVDVLKKPPPDLRSS